MSNLSKGFRAAGVQKSAVLDDRREPVTGLDRTCFDVIVAGQSRPVAFFEDLMSRPLSLAILLDIGSGMSEENVRKGKQLIFDLIHILEHEDQIIIGIFGDRETTTPDAEKNKLSGRRHPQSR